MSNYTIEEFGISISLASEITEDSDALKKFVGEILQEMRVKKINSVLCIEESPNPTASDRDILDIVNKVFNSLPFRIKIAIFNKDFSPNANTHFVETMNSSKGNLTQYFNEKDKAIKWLEDKSELTTNFIAY